MNLLLLKNIGDVDIQIAPEAHAQKALAISEAREITFVRDQFSQEIALSAMKSLKVVINGTEASRKEVKAPMLAISKNIDTLAKEFVQEATDEYLRVSLLVNSFETEKRRISEEAEAKIEAERQRIAAEKKKLEDAEREAADAARRAQQVARNEEEKLRLHNLEQERMSKAIVDRSKLQKEQVALSKEIIKSIPTKAEGSVVRETWKCEVLDIHALYAKRSDLVRLEPIMIEINDEIRKGLRELPGCRIYKEISTGVR
jgi:hypothetical protein